MTKSLPLPASHTRVDVITKVPVTTPASAVPGLSIEASTPTFERSIGRCNGVIVEGVESWSSTSSPSAALGSVLPLSTASVGGGAPLVNGDVPHRDVFPLSQHKSAPLGKLSLHSTVNSPYLSPVSPNDVTFHEPTSLSTKSPTMMLTPSPLGGSSSSSTSTVSVALPLSTSVLSSACSVITNTPSTPSTIGAPPLPLGVLPHLGLAPGEPPVVVADDVAVHSAASLRVGVIKKLDSPPSSGQARSATGLARSSTPPHSSAPDYTVISPHKLALRKHLEEEEERQRTLSTGPGGNGWMEKNQNGTATTLGSVVVTSASRSTGEAASESTWNSRRSDAGGDAWITASSNRRRTHDQPMENKSIHLPAKLVHKTTNHSSQRTPSSIAGAPVTTGPAIVKNITLGDQMRRIIDEEYNYQGLQQRQRQSKSRRRSGKHASPAGDSGDGPNLSLSLNFSSQERGRASSSHLVTSASAVDDLSQLSAHSNVPLPRRTDADSAMVRGQRVGLPSSASPSGLDLAKTTSPALDRSKLASLPSDYLRNSSPTSSAIFSSRSRHASISSSLTSSMVSSSHSQPILVTALPAGKTVSSPALAATAHSYPAGVSLLAPVTPAALLPASSIANRPSSASGPASFFSPAVSSPLVHSRLTYGSSTPSPPFSSVRTGASKAWAPLTPPPSIRPAAAPITSITITHAGSLNSNVALAIHSAPLSAKNSFPVGASGPSIHKPARD